MLSKRKVDRFRTHKGVCPELNRWLFRRLVPGVQLPVQFLLFLLLALPVVISLRARDKAHAALVLEQGFAVHERVADGVRSVLEDIEKVPQNELSAHVACGTEAILIALGPVALSKAVECGTNPVVYALVSVPRLNPLAQSERVTGVASELPLRRTLEELKSLLQRGMRAGILYSTDENHALADEFHFLDPEFGVTTLRQRVQSVQDIGRALQQLVDKDKIQLLWILPDPVFTPAAFKRIAEICERHKILLISSFEALVEEAGAAIAIAPSLFDVGVKAARLAEKIEAGIAPKLLGYEFPQQYGVYINQALVRRMQYRIPAGLMRREKVTTLTEEGLAFLRRGDKAAALSAFDKVLALEPGNAQASFYAGSIRAEEAWTKAQRHLQQRNLRSALPELVIAARHIAEARTLLGQVRMNLQGEVARVLERGTESFESRKFAETIRAMDYVLLIDPANTKARLYREKAEQRLRALKGAK